MTRTAVTVNKTEKTGKITRVMIPYVEKHISAKYIRNVFKRLEIANISNVDIQPRNDDTNYNKVVMHVDDWYDNESAYNLIRRIKSTTHEARIMYDEPNWWILRETPSINEKKKEKKMAKKIWKKAEKELMKQHYETIIESYIQQKIDDYKNTLEIEDSHDWDELSRLIDIEVNIM